MCAYFHATRTEQHYVQLSHTKKTLNTNKCTKNFYVNYNTLLHVSTLLGHPHGETFRCR
jgi:hypothetical protein